MKENGPIVRDIPQDVGDDANPQCAGTAAMAAETVETLIVGGGQAGLAMSDMLNRRGMPHLVIERGRIAERWRSERWDGLRFQFPNWSVRLPDCTFPHADPDGFATSGEIIDYIEAYARQIRAPLRCGVEATKLRANEGEEGFVASTTAGPIKAANVVVATGPYQRPAIPDLLLPEDNLFELHASAYKNPDQLPVGAVLVVGSGASGAQIGEELVRAGRRVYLSIGRHKRVPRIYRGRDVIWWLEAMRLDQMTAEQRGSDTTLALITGAYGGHTIDFREFAAQGITLLGRLQGSGEGILHFAADLGPTLDYGDASYRDFLERADRFVNNRGTDFPVDHEACAGRCSNSPGITDSVRQIDIKRVGISSVIWATGYRFDFDWIELPVLDGGGRPKHQHGISPVPGIYFLGLPWLSKMNSSFLSGVADDAARLANCICQGEPGEQPASFGTS
jgi:putative flavoprotein involved in K+ transport